MLEFTVDGKLPGSELTIVPGSIVRVKAAASGGSVLPRWLEVVAHGDVVRRTQDAAAHRLELEFDWEVEHGAWLAARCAGAHTTPVYVLAGDKRFWKTAAVSELVSIRMRQLDDIESLIANPPRRGFEGSYNNPDGFRRQEAALRERIEAARVRYRDLLHEAQSPRR